MTRPLLRQATRDDLPGIWRVRYAVVENPLTPGCIDDDEVIAQIETTGRGWVVEEDGAVVAFAIGDASGANVWALFVDPRAEGRGYGSRLHDTMVEWLWTHGLNTLWLSTGTDTKARGFYERRGWRCIGPDGEKAVRLELTNAWP
ncbi:MAG: GNAT family N-acetyltransferase [Burkholderiaceae bacterium]|jgi:GNAT superfamily N-acetyltransferase